MKNKLLILASLLSINTAVYADSLDEHIHRMTGEMGEAVSYTLPQNESSRESFRDTVLASAYYQSAGSVERKQLPTDFDSNQNRSIFQQNVLVSASSQGKKTNEKTAEFASFQSSK